MSIYFKGGEKAKNVKELLELGFVEKWNHPYGKDIYKFCKTFKDEGCWAIDFKIARRSFKDLFEIAKTYFPKITKEEFAYILLNQIPQMYSFYCPTTSLVVFMKLVNDTNKKCKYNTSTFARTKKDINNISYQAIYNLSKAYKLKKGL